MSHKMGNWLMAVGIILLLAALALMIWNQLESRDAQNASREIQRNVLQKIEQAQIHQAQLIDSQHPEKEIPNVYDTSMTEVEISGYNYIGYVSVPELGLELPVMSEWDYTRLKIAPCRCHGAIKTKDMVIAAHNYASHFGGISGLMPGDRVYFTDMDGIVYPFQVADVEVLEITDVDRMYAGEYPLTLFTCTYGGSQRITVRCDSISS